MPYRWKKPIRARKSSRYDPCRRCRGIFTSDLLEIDPSQNESARKWVCHSCANAIRKLSNQPEWDYEKNCWANTKHRKKKDPDQLTFDDQW